MKNIRGKENSQVASNQWVSSTYRVESDQKDLIIKALKGDCDNLKKNENQYHRLYDTYKQLQHKYKLLHDEKDNDDREFKMRHEAALRNISQLKNQIDALKAELRDKRLQTSDLETDEATLKQQCDEKNIQLQNLRNDYKSCIADSEELAAEKESLNNATTKLRAIINQAQNESRLLKEDNDSVGRRLEELSRYQDQLVLQQKILREKILGYQNENNELDNTINQYCERLSNIQLGIKKAQDELAELQQAMTQLGLLNQKYKTENNLVQKNIQNEVIKNNNFTKNMKNAEYTQKVRVGQVEEASQEVVGLKAENESLDRINQKLAEDLQACCAHLQNLGIVNSKLVEHLQNFSREDQEVREVLNRKGRVQFARGRVSEVVSQKATLAQTRFPSSSRAEYR